MSRGDGSCRSAVSDGAVAGAETETESKAKDSPAAQADRELQIAQLHTPARLRRRRSRTIPLLNDWNSIPSYLRDNEYIKKYYRVDYTFSQTLRSLFSIHNETGSVWTHLLGVILFVVLTILTIAARPAPLRFAGEHLSGLETRIVDSYSGLWRLGKNWESCLRDAGEQVEMQVMSARTQIEEMLSKKGRQGNLALQEIEQRLQGYGDARMQDLLQWYHWLLEKKISRNMRAMEAAIFHGLTSVVDLQWPSKRWPIHVFTAGAIFCLATSTFCHLFGSFGYKRFAQKVWRYDYAGITVLIVTSFVPVVYYSFLCSPAHQYFYLISTVSLGIVTVAVSLMSTFQSVKYRTFRACLFAGLGLWGIVPGIHALYLYGAASPLQKAFGLDVLMGATYLLGASLYAARIPERWKPGAFDLWFNSHQIFHVAVVIAAAIHYWGVRVLLKWRDTTGGCTLPFDDVLALQALQNATKG